MSKRETKEIEKLVIDNMRLVQYVLKKLGIDRTNYNYEDLIQVGYIGLIKGAETFNSNISKFPTYACICIRNEILMYFRKEPNSKILISLEDSFFSNSIDNSILTYGDTIEDTESRFVEKIIGSEEIKEILSLILNCLTSREKIMMLYSISGVLQKDISIKLNLSQPTISKMQKPIREKLKLLMKANTPYTIKYQVEIIKNIISISTTIENYKNLISIICSEINPLHNIYNFSLKCIESKLIVEIPKEELSSFYVIARIIQIIEESY